MASPDRLHSSSGGVMSSSSGAQRSGGDGDVAGGDAASASPDLQHLHAYAPTSATAEPLSGLLPGIHLKRPSEAGLHLQTDIFHQPFPSRNDLRKHESFPDLHEPFKASRHIESSSLSRPPMVSQRSFDGNIHIPWSPSSTSSSPALNALGDVTPLPSPLLIGGSPDRFRRIGGRPSSGSLSSFREEGGLGILTQAIVNRSSSRKKKLYPNLQGSPSSKDLESATGHERTRSTSEYIPDPLQNTRPRNVSAPGAPAADQETAAAPLPPPTTIPDQLHPLHREQYLALQRRLAPTLDPRLSIPTPPSSNRSITDSSEEGERRRSRDTDPKVELLVIRDSQHRPLSYWESIRPLGRGAFSEVFLAKPASAERTGSSHDGSEELVAIKVVSHDVENKGSDEQRMEISIKREIEILQYISHPCLPLLKAFDESATRALLVMNYCPGGDLFELASEHRPLLSASLIRRVAAELVAAVSYLHGQGIVHRDIKLENVLFNVETAGLGSITDPQTYPFALTTLTDLGLSRRVTPGEMLTHPCGSADYAAPELLLGSAYDGRATDTWALGVLFYALLEGRLPFDPVPGSRRQNNPKHRIARCDWVWCDLGDKHGDWAGGGTKDGGRPCPWTVEDGEQLEGARDIIEGMLCKVRTRWSLDKVQEHPWIAGGIRLEDGLTRKPT